MGKIKVIVPTHKRADILTTNVKNQILCIHESEKDDYKDLPFEKVYHDKQNLAQIRNFIYKKFGDVFMIDDDIVSVERLFRTTDVILTPDEIYNLIQETGYIAKQVGASLFGFSNSQNPKHYKPQKPFVANGYINACAFGLLKDKNLYFNEKTTAVESHWINLLNAYFNRFSFQDTRYTFRQKPNSTFRLKGGQTLKRTLETEKKDTLILRLYFGNSVLLKKGQKDSKKLHKYQRKINIKL